MQARTVREHEPGAGRRRQVRRRHHFGADDEPSQGPVSPSCLRVAVAQLSLQI